MSSADPERAPEGRLNFDASPRLKVKHLVGIRKLLK